MIRDSKRGQVTTFYSYKGGTGRTFVLANVAFLLASLGKRVCVLDWDLEAPGLHRFFRPFLEDPELEITEGLIDWLWDVTAYQLSSTESSPTAHSLSTTSCHCPLRSGSSRTPASWTSCRPDARTASTPSALPPSTGTRSTTGSAALGSSTGAGVPEGQLRPCAHRQQDRGQRHRRHLHD